MLIYALQSFTATDGTVCASGNTYTLTDSAANIAIHRGQVQAAQMPVHTYPPSGSFPGALNADRSSLLDPLTCSDRPLSSSPALTTVIIGNSIAAIGKHISGTFNYWAINSEIHVANSIAYNPMQFSRITATTRADGWGCYGYSGQTLPTILADLQAQLFTPLQTAGVVPGLVVAHALLENDIGQGATFTSMKASLTQFIREVQARYPNAILLLATPHLSFSYNTPALVANYKAVRDYILSLDDGVSIFVARLDTYENPDSPGTPLGTPSAPIFTDTSVHPNARGAMRNARVIAATLGRIASTWRRNAYSIATNMTMSGTAAASGTNVTGTVPTSVSCAGSIYGTFVTLAEQPGYIQTITANASGTSIPSDLGTSSVAQVAYTGGANTLVSPFAEMEIVSGAENVGWIEIDPRFSDGTGNVFSYYLQRQTGDAFPEFVDGDRFLFIMPPMKLADISGLTGNFAGFTQYFRAWPTFAGGQFQVRVISSGFQIVTP